MDLSRIIWYKWGHCYPVRRNDLPHVQNLLVLEPRIKWISFYSKCCDPFPHPPATHTHILFAVDKEWICMKYNLDTRNLCHLPLQSLMRRIERHHHKCMFQLSDVNTWNSQQTTQGKLQARDVLSWKVPILCHSKRP